MDAIEQWKSVDGWPYEVSDQGRVRRCLAEGRFKVLSKGRSLEKYVHVTLIRDLEPRRRYVRIHILVTRAFLGPCPPGKEVNHKNLLKGDNRLENLEYISHRENIKHAAENLRLAHGYGAWASKLTEEKVREIRKACDLAANQHELAKKYGVSQSTIQAIYKRETWKHVKDD